MKSVFYENNIVFMNSSDSEVFKNVLDVVFITSGTSFNQKFENCVMVNSCQFGNILDFDI